MKKATFLAIICCAAMMFVACKDENLINIRQSNNHDTKYDTKEAVDLGLSSGVKWATCNVGATNPEEYGNYYAWGSTDTVGDYSWERYKYAYGSRNELAKYCTLTEYGNNGYIDNKTVLEPTDDAATQNWGESWRTPTIEEWQELIDSCTWTWTTNYKKTTNVSGYEVKGKNGNSIFIPAAGYWYGNMPYNANYGYYWSSSLRTDIPYGAWNMYFFADFSYMVSQYRFYGMAVRPVYQTVSER